VPAWGWVAAAAVISKGELLMIMCAGVLANFPFADWWSLSAGSSRVAQLVARHRKRRTESPVARWPSAGSDAGLAPSQPPRLPQLQKFASAIQAVPYSAFAGFHPNQNDPNRLKAIEQQLTHF